MLNLDSLKAIAGRDAVEVHAKDATYGSSWKQRGGVGAFMMLARKWDRIEQQAKLRGWDIFEAIRQSGNLGDDDTLLGDIRDLRRYLILVENEVLDGPKTAAQLAADDGGRWPVGGVPERQRASVPLPVFRPLTHLPPTAAEDASLARALFPTPAQEAKPLPAAARPTPVPVDDHHNLQTALNWTDTQLRGFGWRQDQIADLRRDFTVAGGDRTGLPPSQNQPWTDNQVRNPAAEPVCTPLILPRRDQPCFGFDPDLDVA